MRQFLRKASIVCCVMFILSGCNEPVSEPVTATVSPTKDNSLPPEVVFEETSADFGQAGPGTMLKKEIKFHNKGEGTLEIQEILLCCGVMAGTDKTFYEPGETGILTIELQSPGATGPFEREPMVYTNDPMNPKIVINVFVDVVQKVVWSPEKFKLLLDSENGACPQLTIKCIDEQPFSITGFRSTGNCITAKYNPTIKKTEHVLDLKVDMDKLPEQNYGEVTVNMNHPEGTIATIFFDVVPKYTISPKPVYVINAKENVAQEKLIKIISNYKEDFEVESLSSKEKTVELIDSKKVDGHYELNVKITPPSMKDGSIRFSDIIYINLKNGEQLELVCSIYYE